jgi:predicted HTH transcriptional regulator
LNDNQLDPIQRELLQYCQLIQPSYFPVLSIEQVEGRNLIVLWAPGGLNRPYKAPRAVTAKTKEYHYYIRRYSSTVEVKPNSEDEQELLRLTGIPKMRAAMERNGSPEPRFSTDEARTHFAVELPVHPALVGLVLRDESYDGAQDEAQDKAQDDLLDLTETESELFDRCYTVRAR